MPPAGVMYPLALSAIICGVCFILVRFTYYAVIPRLGQGFVLFAGAIGLFLEAMQHLNSFHKLGYIHHAVPAVLQINNDFPGAATCLVKRFPMIKFQPELHLAELPAGLSPGVQGKQTVISQIPVRGATPVDWFS